MFAQVGRPPVAVVRLRLAFGASDHTVTGFA